MAQTTKKMLKHANLINGNICNYKHMRHKKILIYSRSENSIYYTLFLLGSKCFRPIIKEKQNKKQ